ncbi:MAG: dihydroorotate dehydrogenase electron transfer subunit [Tissierellia bacterium]|nr:dihydroorotate dehydrogenase electron transfer subunit [Tissierellia bacterium]
MSLKEVLEVKDLDGGYFLLTVAQKEAASVPGQFYMVGTGDGAKLLKRPLSVFDEGEGRLSFLVRTVGKGTELMAQFTPGERVDVEGPFGTGFPPVEEPITFYGGGTGMAPGHHLLKTYGGEKVKVVLGLRAPMEKLEGLFSEFQGSTAFVYGDNILAQGAPQGTVYTCGPEAMMEAVARGSSGKVYASLEGRMGCGFGVCLSCTCKTEQGRERVCTEGPVFDTEVLGWK